MASEEILRFGHEILRKPAQKVKDFNDEVRGLIDLMFRVMKEHSGLGLAANQVGVDLQIFTYDIGEGPHAVVNPKLVRSRGEQVAVEGCLSVPGIQGEVARAEDVTIKGLDENGRPIRIRANGLLARVFQHEIDHLQGHLFLDRADPETLYEVPKRADEPVEVAEPDSG